MSGTRWRRVCAVDDVALTGIGGLHKGTVTCQLVAISRRLTAGADRLRPPAADDMSRIPTDCRDHKGQHARRERLGRTVPSLQPPSSRKVRRPFMTVERLRRGL